MPRATSSCGIAVFDAAHVAIEMKGELLLHDGLIIGRLDDGLRIEPVRRLSGRRRQRTKRGVVVGFKMQRKGAVRSRARSAE
jgi:hypothetical protein